MQKFNKELHSSTYLVNSCPLCKSRNFKDYNYYYVNRYTEEFANYFKLDQSDLMRIFQQKICQNCNLVFKERWFKDKVLRTIYSHQVPVHPNGWDIYSKKFSKKNFINNLNKLKKKNNIKNIDALKRSILSIVESIDYKTLNVKNTIIKFTNYLKKNEFKKIDKIKNTIIESINKPKKFSRFTGFNNIDLFNFIEKKIGKINNYTEIGCPLWGLLRTCNQKKIKCNFIKPNYNFFWGKECKYKTNYCLDTIKKFTSTIKLNPKKKFNYIGIYNYLDHINDLSKFISKIFKKFDNIGIIQEDKTRGYPIQHNYGINKNCMSFIAKKFKKKLILNKKMFKNTKYNFYLFV